MAFLFFFSPSSNPQKITAALMIDFFSARNFSDSILWSCSNYATNLFPCALPLFFRSLGRPKLSECQLAEQRGRIWL